MCVGGEGHYLEGAGALFEACEEKPQLMKARARSSGPGLDEATPDEAGQVAGARWAW
jgi:hypothetical protein